MKISCRTRRASSLLIPFPAKYRTSARATRGVVAAAPQAGAATATSARGAGGAGVAAAAGAGVAEDDPPPEAASDSSLGRFAAGSPSSA